MIFVYADEEKGLETVYECECGFKTHNEDVFNEHHATCPAYLSYIKKLRGE